MIDVSRRRTRHFSKTLAPRSREKSGPSDVQESQGRGTTNPFPQSTQSASGPTESKIPCRPLPNGQSKPVPIPRTELSTYGRPDQITEAAIDPRLFVNSALGQVGLERATPLRLGLPLPQSRPPSNGPRAPRSRVSTCSSKHQYRAQDREQARAAVQARHACELA